MALTKAEAIAALQATDGELTQSALIDAGLWSQQATLLGRILDHRGCSEKVQYGRRELLVPLEQAIAAIAAMDDPLEIPLEQRSVDYVVVAVPYRNGDAVLDVGDRLSRQAMCDILREYFSVFDGVEMERLDRYYRLYQGTLYLLEGGELDRDAGCVVGAEMIEVTP